MKVGNPNNKQQNTYDLAKDDYGDFLNLEFMNPTNVSN